jgi:putative inorganic carbon (HCO3(-)) transporter
LEIGALCLLAPWFIVPSLGFQPWMMSIPLIFWVIRLFSADRKVTHTPLDIPILVMGIMLGISMVVTCDLELSLPKVAGIFYGIVAYSVMSNHVSWNLVKRLILPSLILAGFLIAGLSLLGMRWSNAKLPLIGEQLQSIGKSIPRLLNSIPRAEKGISANQLGGTLILLIPLQATLFIFSIRTQQGQVLGWPRTVGCGLVLCLNLFVLLLTQSRGALAAGVVTLSTLSLFYIQRRRWLITILVLPSLLLGGVLILMNQPAEMIVEEELREISDSFALKNRPEIWSRAYRMIKDHPYTGIGFDTFPTVLSARYPTFLIRPDDARVIPHAHNLYLQTALDLGIPGLVAFLALHFITSWMLIRTVRDTNSHLMRAIAVGLLLGLGAQLLYGWVDCIALGQKPSIFFWGYLGLSTVIFNTDFANRQKGI